VDDLSPAPPRDRGGLLYAYERYLSLYERFVAGDDDAESDLARVEEEIIAGEVRSRADFLGKCRLAAHLATRVGAGPADPRLLTSIADLAPAMVDGSLPPHEPMF